MPRHTTGRAASGRGLRAPSEARPSVRRPAPVRLSRTAARECAARLMASGPALPVPRLAVGCLEPFLPSNTYSGAFDLARNLLLAGVGQAEDWERSKGDPVAFMLRTVERTAAGFNRKASMRWPIRTSSSARAPISQVGTRRNTKIRIGCSWRLRPPTFRSFTCAPLLNYSERRIPGCRQPSIGCCSKAWRPGSSAMTNPLARLSTSGAWNRIWRPRRAARRVWRSRRASRTQKGHGWRRRFKPLPSPKIEAAIESLKSGSRARRILEAARRLQTALESS